MKVVHVCLDAIYADGYSYQENILPKYHLKFGYDVTVIASLVSFDNKGQRCVLEYMPPYMDPSGFKIIRLNYKRPKFIWRLLRKYDNFNTILESEAPDVIYSHNIGYADILTVAAYLKNHSNVKLYCDNHVDYINSGNNFITKYVLNYLIRPVFARKIFQYSDRFWGVTPMRCKFLEHIYHVPSDKVDFLPMGVDDDAIPKDIMAVRQLVRKELDIKDNEFVIFSGGKIDRRKNIHILLDAIAAIHDDSIHVLICGVITPEMAPLIANRTKNPNIHYLGWCSSDRVMDCMIASDIACFPGTHSTLWEQSVGVGLPLVCNRWVDINHVNVNGNCLFVNGSDSQEVANGIKRVLSPSYYSYIKNLAKEASASFLYSNIARKSINIY